MTLRYISIGQYESAFDAGAGFCVSCGERHEGLAAHVAFMTCVACHLPLVFSAKELGERDYVLLPNSSLVNHGPTYRPRMSRGH